MNYEYIHCAYDEIETYIALENAHSLMFPKLSYLDEFTDIGYTSGMSEINGLKYSEVKKTYAPDTSRTRKRPDRGARHRHAHWRAPCASKTCQWRRLAWTCRRTQTGNAA